MLISISFIKKQETLFNIYLKNLIYYYHKLKYFFKNNRLAKRETLFMTIKKVIMKALCRDPGLIYAY